MRFLIQVVDHASVTVDEQVTGKIGPGMLVLIGLGARDDQARADRMIDKMLKLRIFEDENGKTNKSLADVKGSLLLVSQFTLYANCRHGNRPGFTDALAPEPAEQLYHYIVEHCRERVSEVQEGIFGAYMKVELVNSGPFTVILDSDELGY